MTRLIRNVSINDLSTDALDLTINIVCSCLQLDPRDTRINASTPLLGGLPDFNSLAIAAVIERIEEQTDCTIHDEELTGEIFESVSSLSDFVESKLKSRQ